DYYCVIWHNNAWIF
nr:immunoglobulin light chain junction region [Macaca mulatta]MOX78679.1 immunoglobulin light chain junction region [Macaca mulatta]MOX79287.1 immunoglobulin light chain junction region [Macaca mulatta]MOX81769.1 immunoglobulin light chain junction region [Macaca mulatta]MOX81903.1 immunoglobulin light chain junction region [Macaca mulatta]